MPGWRRAQFARLTLSTVLAGAFFTLWMLPCAPQILAYLKRSTALGAMGPSWWAEWIGCLTTGIQLGIYDGRPPAGFGRVYDIRDSLKQPMLIGVSAIVIPLFWLAGAARMIRARRIAALVVCIAVLSPLIAWAHNRTTGNYLYPWYLIYFLPLSLLLVGVALEGAAHALTRRGTGRGVAFAALCAAYLALFLHATTEPRRRLTAASPHPEYVSFARGKYEDRVYREGWITRHVRPEWRARNPLQDPARDPAPEGAPRQTER